MDTDITYPKSINVQFYEKIEDKISKIYEGTGKNFILHLIRAFLPMNENTKMRGFKGEADLVCCLTNQKLTGITDINDRSTKLNLLILKNEIFLNHKEGFPEKLVSEYIDAYENSSDEVRRRNVAYCSENSDKFLSEDALIALNRFAKIKLQEGDVDIVNILDKKPSHRSKNNKSKKSERGFFDKVTFGDIPALRDISNKK